jgi:hypothetical protein
MPDPPLAPSRSPARIAAITSDVRLGCATISPARRLGQHGRMMAGSDSAARSRCFPARPDELRGMRDALRSACARGGSTGVRNRRRDGGRRGLPERDPPPVAEAGRRHRAGGALRGDGSRSRCAFRPPWTRPGSAAPLDELRPGGLGTHLIRSAMDHTELVKPPSGPGNR